MSDSSHQANTVEQPDRTEEQCNDSSDQFYDCQQTQVLTEEELDRRKHESNDLKTKGNDLFKQKLYDESIDCYTEALSICPKQLVCERSVLHSNRSAALIHCNRLDEALEDSNAAIDLNPDYVKAILRRAQMYRQINDKLDDSLKDYQRVLELDPNCTEAVVACDQLKTEIIERNERLKTEMMSKLKDLGNLVLRPFGLSTDNFKLSQNADNGGYSVNFQNN